MNDKVLSGELRGAWDRSITELLGRCSGMLAAVLQVEVQAAEGSRMRGEAWSLHWRASLCVWLPRGVRRGHGHGNMRLNAGRALSPGVCAVTMAASAVDFYAKVAKLGTEWDIFGARIVMASPDLRAAGFGIDRIGGGAIMAASGSTDIAGLELERLGSATTAV